MLKRLAPSSKKQTTSQKSLNHKVLLKLFYYRAFQVIFWFTVKGFWPGGKLGFLGLRQKFKVLLNSKNNKDFILPLGNKRIFKKKQTLCPPHILKYKNNRELF